MRNGMGRRDFLKNAAWMGAGAALVGQMAGCKSMMCCGGRGPAVMGAHYAPLPKIRVAVIGLGMRGPGAVHHYASIPGVEVTALCDLYEDRAKAQRDALVKDGKPEPKIYAGSEEAWKGVCDSANVDLVHITTPWLLHAPQAVYAMKAGKHAVSEVPCAVTLDECWELVETSEATKRHFMMLENCCYGETELLALNLCRKGVLGTLVHGEGAYLHDLRDLKMSKSGYQGMWRLKFSEKHTGNPYPMHGLGPICQYMSINRGDRMEYLVSVSSSEFGLTEYAREHFGAASPEARQEYRLGDMNTTVIKTARGRTIMVQHNTTTGRPYSRINLIEGTKGILADYPLRVALAPNAHEWLNDQQLKELSDKYRHPLWSQHGEAAKRSGGHGGMDFLLLLRLCYCLQNGLPLDIDACDSALWASLVELTERSVLKRGSSVDVPDFTRGAWKTTPPLGIVDVG